MQPVVRLDCIHYREMVVLSIAHCQLEDLWSVGVRSQHFTAAVLIDMHQKIT